VIPQWGILQIHGALSEEQGGSGFMEEIYGRADRDDDGPVGVACKRIKQQSAEFGLASERQLMLASIDDARERCQSMANTASIFWSPTTRHVQVPVTVEVPPF
jgi:hypothetical protein